MLQVDDGALAATVHRELSALIGVPLPAPLDTRVQRWGGALPQYAPGHLDRVAAARAAPDRRRWRWPAPAYDGVGIPVCVRSGERAADDVLSYLRNGKGRNT